MRGRDDPRQLSLRPGAQPSLRQLIASYDASAPLARARTLPSAFYLDPRVAELEREAAFAASWQAVGRAEQLAAAGDYLTAFVAGEPVLVLRDAAGELRAFFNVCRHHAAAVATEECGKASVLRCPYHGWTYGLDGKLRGVPEFEGVRAFAPAENGLVPLEAGLFEGFVLVRVSAQGPSLSEFVGGLAERVAPLRLGTLRFFERRSYELRCNWKVFVDNYLDGGYHVPHLHKGLHSVLDHARYEVENGERFCLQSSPLTGAAAEPGVRATRRGERAFYFWLYPNFMINVYEGVMDTNLVLPLAVDRTRVVFDFYFEDVSEAARGRNRASVLVAERIQEEDVAICEAVQRGLGSRAYETGRLSVRREAGEQLFHRLLSADLRRGLGALPLQERSAPVS